MEELDNLVSKLHNAEKRLTVGKASGQSKWKYPLQILEEVQDTARGINDIVSKDLDKLLHWPRHSTKLGISTIPDSRLFYEGNHEARFSRTDNWFNAMGFTKYETPYTFSDNWDRQYIQATYLVPNNLMDSDKIPVVWYFHGGGFCTGASDHIPWYAAATLKHAHTNKAIIIAPDYPLGPEANYHDISCALKDFLRFYQQDGCFENNEHHWTHWLTKQIGKKITLNTSSILIEAESAGAHAAVTTIFHNAMLSNASKLHISAAFLRYPMVAHYRRTYPSPGPFNFMGVDFTKPDLDMHAQRLKDEITKIETLTIQGQTGFMRTRCKGYAPEYMWSAPLLSLTGQWTWMFQRDHGRLATTVSVNDTAPWNYDCLERARELCMVVDHEALPPLVVHHAVDDANCAFADTEEFKEVLHECYPSRYPRDKCKDGEGMVWLVPVTELRERDGVVGNVSTVVGHGYDYWQVGEPFQKACYDFVAKYWPGVPVG